MKADSTRDTINYVLNLLDEKNIKLSKILIHKFMYFLDINGCRAGLSFEPYTYGPFSFNLARELEAMVFWDEIEEEKNYYKIKKLPPESLASPEKQKINNLFEKFSSITNNKYDFKSVEIIGTILYCAQSLKSLGEDITKNSIITAFKEWKGEKYPDSEIVEFYDKISQAS